MHDFSFCDSIRQPHAVVLRLPMRPYSIGHECLLIRARNPFVLDGFDKLDAVVKHAALIEAVLICSRTWLQNGQPHRWLRLWGFIVKGCDFDREIEKFQAYKAAGSLYPPAPDRIADTIANGITEEGRNLGGPFMARLYYFLCNLPESEVRLHGDSAFDFPLGLATFLHCSYLEEEGRRKIENQKEAELKTEVSEHLEAFKRESLNGKEAALAPA